MKFPDWPLHNSINKIDLGLNRISKLLDKLGNPQDKIKSVFHITGTNGKGSVSAYLKYILEEGGYTVNRYTSPHLVRFNERIEICGREITDDYYNELANECKTIVEKYNLDVSYFEIITTIAFMAFARNKADATILEVGMGGRLDATNIIKNPLVSIITPISLDHINTLGNTIEKIAIEKIAIVKDNCNAVISKQEKSVVNTIKNKIKNKTNCNIFYFNDDYNFVQIDDNICRFTGFKKDFMTKLPSLYGKHQIINAGTAIAAILCQNKLNCTNKNISDGISKTIWKGRLQNLKNTKLYNYLPKDSELFLDGSHNEGGAKVIKDWITEKDKIKKMENILIISMLKRKDTTSYINIIKNVFDGVIVVSPDKIVNKTDKYKTIEEFSKEFKTFGVQVLFGCNNIIDALKYTNKIITTKKLRILICGSLYFCGDVLSLIEN